MRIIRAIVISSALFAATPCFAEAPHEIEPTIKAENPYGKGAFRALFMTAYDAELWTDATHWSMQVPSR